MALGKLFSRTSTGSADTTDTAGATLAAILKGVQVGQPMRTYRGAMSIPGAWRAALLISDLLGRLPWDAYRTRGGGPVELLDPTPPLLEQPCGQETRMATFSSWTLDLLWHGNALGVIAERNNDGYPTAVMPVPVDWSGARRVNGSDFSPLPYGAIEYQVGAQVFGAHDVIHIKGPCEPGAVRGMGVIEAHLDGALDLASDLGKQAAAISRHGVPTGLLKMTNPDATKDEAREAKEGWLKQQEERTVATIGPTVDFTPLSWNPEELQLVEARKFSLHEIALIFGLPLYWLGADQASRTYSNVESEGMNLLKYTLGGHLARFEQTLSSHFPRGTTVKANLDSILRADILDRYKAHEIALANNFLTPDEVRDREDMAPFTDEQLAQIGLFLEMHGKRGNNPESPPAEPPAQPAAPDAQPPEGNQA